jgi:hypothetical protein
MYEYYYSSSDVQVYFFSKDGTRFIKYDKAISIGYNIMQTSTPIYGLQSSKAAYFSRGNTICQGMLLSSFVDEEYLKIILKYIFKEEADLAPKKDAVKEQLTANLKKLDNNTFTLLAEESKTWTNEEDGDRIISIGNIYEEFDIKLFLNNESVYRTSSTKIITLDSVKIVSDSLDISSGSDSHLAQGHKFIFKDVKRG